MNKTVTVITSTIGRPELKKCIESVRDQTYPVNHMVFVNGPKYRWNALQVLQDFPHVKANYLHEETGDYNGSGPTCASVLATAPHLTNSDWVFFLNDDDFYDPNHVESVMNLVNGHDLKWAYSLRRIVTKSGDPICDDDWCSLGHWPIVGTDQYLVDNSCYAVSRPLAQKHGLAWTAFPMIGDRCFLMALKESGERYGCTGLSTVNYRIGTGSAADDPDMYLGLAKSIRLEIKEPFPWRKPSVFG